MGYLNPQINLSIKGISCSQGIYIYMYSVYKCLYSDVVTSFKLKVSLVYYKMKD